jgi:hypothetical protein
LAIVDQDINITLKNKTTKLLMPYLYSETRDKLSFNIEDFFKWYTYGIWLGLMSYYVSYISYYNALNDDGNTFGLWQFSMSSYFSMALINVVLAGMYIGSWNVMWIIVYIIHIILFYPGWVFIYNEWPYSHIYKNQLDFYSYTLFFFT